MRRASGLVAGIGLVLVAIWWSMRSPTGSPLSTVLVESATTAPVATEVPLVLPEPGSAARSTTGAEELVAAVPTSAEPRIEAIFVLAGAVIPALGRTELIDRQEILLTDEDGIVRRALTDDSERFEFAGLRAGRYWLDTESRENGDAEAVVELVADTRRDLALVLPTVVLVRVEGLSPMETLLRHVRAIATLDPPGERVLRGSRIGTVGRYEPSLGGDLPGVPAQYSGVLVLDGEPPFHASLVRDGRVLATRLVRRGQTEVVFDLPEDDPRVRTGGVRFRFVDAATNAPIQNASASFDGGNSRAFSCPAGIGASEGLAAGSWTLTIQAPDFAPRRIALEITPGETTDLGDVSGLRDVVVRGTILGPNGSPEQAKLRFEACDEHAVRAADFPASPLRSTGPDGTFRFPFVHPDRYRLEVDVASIAGAAEAVRIVDARRGSADVRVELVQGVPVVVRPGDGWRPGWGFRVTDAHGLRIVERALDAPRPRRVLLAPGAYTIELSRGTRPATSVPIVVDREPVRIDMP